MALRVNFPFGRTVDVFVTHVDDVSGNFFVQINDEAAGKLESLMAEIEEYARREPATLKASEITVGDIYLAQYFEDETWYRARVLDVQDRCEVFFVDFGNTEFVLVDSVRPAKAKFLDLPPQAFECELHGIENVRGPGFQEAVSSLRDRILEKELSCRGESLKKNNVLVVDLYTDKAGARSVMGDMLSAGISGEPSRQLGLKYQQVSLKSDSFHDLCVTHVQDPGHFWCQLITNVDHLQDLMDRLAEEYSDQNALPELMCCSVGRPCCAKFVEDGSWYRAVITNVGSLASGEVEVRFVDYGNSQKTPLSDVKELKAGLQALPVQGVEFMVDGIQSTAADKHWSTDAMSLFAQLIKDKHVVGLVTGQERDGRYRVKLFDTTSEVDLEVNQVLIAAGYALKADQPSMSPSQEQSLPPTSKVPLPPAPVFVTENITPGLEEKALVSSADNPSLFYCQLYRNSDKLLKLMKDINQHYSKLGPSEELLTAPSPGDPCCAQFTIDGCWYRAVVKEISSGKVLVLYIDYGNSETLPIKNIKRLLPRFSELPQQGVECSLNRIRANGKTWSQKATKRFITLTEEAVKLKVVAQEDHGIHRVELVIQEQREEKNISDELLLDGSAVLTEGSLPSSEHFHEIVAKHDYPSLPLAVGQYEDVVVSFTEDPCSFWCQMSKFSIEHGLLMRQIEEHYAGSEGSLTSPSLGMPCCAQFSEDDVWYRGKITGLMKGKFAEVQFVDYGNAEVLPLNRIRKIKPEFMKQSSQAIHCSLSNIAAPSSWPENAFERFEDLTMGKELVLRADSYDESSSKYSALLLDTSDGKNLSIADEIAPLLSQNIGVEIPSLAVKPGTSEMVYVTSVTSAEKFFCQVTGTVSNLDKLMGKMESHYARLDTDQERLRKPVVNTFCAAKYAEDDAWYRAKILCVHGDTVTLQYVDFGNSETLPVCRIKVLHPEFGTLPSQVFECSLERSSLGISDAQFKELVLDQEAKAQIVAAKQGGAVEVKLFSLDTGNPIIESQHENESVMPVGVPKAKWNVGDRTMVYITVVDGVTQFYGQLMETFDSLNGLMNKLESHYNALGDKDGILINPKANEFCVTQFTEDQVWYRAQVTGVSGSQAEVLYVDYGNRETQPLQALKVLMPEFSALPAQAVPMALSGMRGTQSEQVDKKFMEQCCDHVFEAHVVSVGPDGVAEVELSSESGSLVHVPRAAESKVALGGGLLEVAIGEVEDVYFVSGNSPDKFWCQLVEEAEALEQLMTALDSHYKALEVSGGAQGPSMPGSVCCAKFSEDSRWYRARVDKLYGGEAEVQFVDYGNSERVALSDIKALDAAFTSLQAQAVECSLANVVPAGSSGVWTDEAIAAFEEIVFSSENTLLIAVGQSATGRHEVMLLADSVDVAWDLSTKGHAFCNYKAAGYRPPASVSLGNFLDLYPTVCHNPSLFCCQVMGAAQIEVLGRLMDQLQECYGHIPSDEQQIGQAAVGMPCVSKFTDGHHYRAAITKVLNQSSAEVYYVDYGNSDVCSVENLKVIDRKFLVLEVQAIYCRLANATPTQGVTWPEPVISRFQELALERQLVGKVLKQVSPDTVEVDLFDTSSDQKDLNITEMLVNEGLAVAAPLSWPDCHRAVTKHISALPTRPILFPTTVFVSVVENPSSFFCHFFGAESELKALQEALAADYDALTPGELSLDSVAVEHLCCAQFSEDGCWYRAVVVKEMPSNQVAVRFIDYGNSEIVDLACVKALRPKFTKDAALAVSCCLVGLKAEGEVWTQEVCTQFEELTLDKELTAESTSTTEPFELTLLDGDVSIANRLVGRSESAKASPERSKQAEYKQPVVAVGDTFDVFITSITSPGQFHCQLVSMGHDLNEVMNDLNLHYLQLSETEGCLVSPSSGQLCVARYSEDEQWYRATVESVSVNNLAVHFIDYGNSETVSPSGVKAIQPRYLALPRAALKCSLDLSNQAWAAEQTALFQKLAGEKQLTVTLLSERDGKFEAKVCEEGVRCINEQVLAKGTSANAWTQLASTELKAGQTEEVFVSHVNSAASFYVQLSQTSLQLEQLAQRLAELDLSSLGALPATHLRVGAACLAVFTQDGCLYRAEVTRILPESSVQVLYIDYGNEACVPLSNLKVLAQPLTQLPKLAVPCRLNCPAEICQSISSDAFEEQVLDKLLMATFLGSDGSWCVDLHDDRRSVVEALKGERATPAADGEEGGVPATLKEISLTAGCVESVYLSFAPGPDAFHVQLQSRCSDLDALSAELEAVYTAEQAEQPSAGQEKLAGACCATSLDDHAWYRAELMRSLPDSTVEVNFVDYGNSQILPAHLVRELKAEFFHQPKFAVLCKLAESETDRAGFFEALDLEKPLHATFSKQEGDKWLVSLKEECPDACVDSLPKRYVKPALLVDSTVRMLFLQAESPSCVFLQRTDDAEKLDELMAAIASDLPDAVSMDLVPGAPCLAQFTEDDAWYRAEVMGLEGDKASVRYVDYGNAEGLPRDRLRPIKDEHLALPVYAVQCGIHTDKPGADVTQLTDALNARLTDEIVDVEVLSSTPDNYTVRLVEQGSSLNVTHNLIQDEASPELSEAVPSCSQNTKDYKRPELRRGDSLPMFYLAAESADSVTLQFAETENELSALLDDMKAAYGDGEAARLLEPHAGQPCSAQFSGDGQWYRAEILTAATTGEKTTVRFVDHGNTEEVASSNVAELRQEFLNLPVQAVECRLWRDASWKPWSDESLEKLDELCSFQRLSVKFVEVGQGLPSVVLHPESGGHSINKQLGGSGLSQGRRGDPREEFQRGSELMLYCTVAESPNSMWFQLADSESELTALVEQLSAHYSALGEQELALDSVDKGDVCCAIYSEDSCWYRATVSAQPKDGVADVRFVDFGNSEAVSLSDIRAVAAEFSSLPAQAVRCSLAGVQPCEDAEDGWGAETVKQLQQLCCENTFRATVAAVDDQKIEVTLRDVEFNRTVTEVLIAEGSCRPLDADVPVPSEEKQAIVEPEELDVPRFKWPSLVAGTKLRATVTHVVSLERFYCQLVDPDGKLAAMMEDLASHYAFPNLEQLDSVVAGQAVCARFTKDDLWYRATVLAAHESDASVLFVDYGNSETLSVSRIKRLTDQFLALPPQAIECTMEGVRPTESDWPEDVVSCFEESVADKQLEVLVVSTRPYASLSVKLVSDGEDFGDRIMQKFPEKVCQDADTRVAQEESEESPDVDDDGQVQLEGVAVVSTAVGGSIPEDEEAGRNEETNDESGNTRETPIAPGSDMGSESGNTEEPLTAAEGDVDGENGDGTKEPLTAAEGDVDGEGGDSTKEPLTAAEGDVDGENGDGNKEPLPAAEGDVDGEGGDSTKEPLTAAEGDVDGENGDGNKEPLPAAEGDVDGENGDGNKEPLPAAEGDVDGEGGDSTKEPLTAEEGDVDGENGDGNKEPLPAAEGDVDGEGGDSTKEPLTAAEGDVDGEGGDSTKEPLTGAEGDVDGEGGDSTKEPLTAAEGDVDGEGGDSTKEPLTAAEGDVDGEGGDSTKEPLTAAEGDVDGEGGDSTKEPFTAAAGDVDGEGGNSTKEPLTAAAGNLDRERGKPDPKLLMEEQEELTAADIDHVGRHIDEEFQEASENVDDNSDEDLTAITSEDKDDGSGTRSSDGADELDRSAKADEAVDFLEELVDMVCYADRFTRRGQCPFEEGESECETLEQSDEAPGGVAAQTAVADERETRELSLAARQQECEDDAARERPKRSVDLMEGAAAQDSKANSVGEVSETEFKEFEKVASAQGGIAAGGGAAIKDEAAVEGRPGTRGASEGVNPRLLVEDATLSGDITGEESLLEVSDQQSQEAIGRDDEVKNADPEVMKMTESKDKAVGVSNDMTKAGEPEQRTPDEYTKDEAYGGVVGEQAPCSEEATRGEPGSAPTGGFKDPELMVITEADPELEGTSREDEGEDMRDAEQQTSGEHEVLQLQKRVEEAIEGGERNTNSMLDGEPYEIRSNDKVGPELVQNGGHCDGEQNVD